MAEKIDYAALKKGGFMRQKQKGYFSLRLQVVGGNLIHNLREKIEPDLARLVYVQAVWDVGYRFNSGKKAHVYFFETVLSILGGKFFGILNRLPETGHSSDSDQKSRK